MKTMSKEFILVSKSIVMACLFIHFRTKSLRANIRNKLKAGALKNVICFAFVEIFDCFLGLMNGEVHISLPLD